MPSAFRAAKFGVIPGNKPGPESIEKTKSVRKLSLALRKVPVELYRLPGELSRKWKPVARDRMALAEWLATHGDGDGSRVRPAEATMTRHFGWSRAKTFRLLTDLQKLKLLEDEQKVDLKTGKLKPCLHGERGTRVRRMNVEAFLGGPILEGCQWLAVCYPRSNQESHIQMQGSQIREQESHVWRDTTVTTDRHQNSKPAADAASDSEKELRDRKKIEKRDRREWNEARISAQEEKARTEAYAGSGPRVVEQEIVHCNPCDRDVPKACYKKCLAGKCPHQRGVPAALLRRPDAPGG